MIGIANIREDIHVAQFYLTDLAAMLVDAADWLRECPREVWDVTVARDRDDDWAVAVYWREE